LHASLQLIGSFSEKVSARQSWGQIGLERAQRLRDAYVLARKDLYDAGFGWAADYAHPAALVPDVRHAIRTAPDGRLLADENAVVSSGPAEAFMRGLDADIRHLAAHEERRLETTSSVWQTKEEETSEALSVDRHGQMLYHPR